MKRPLQLTFILTTTMLFISSVLNASYKAEAAQRQKMTKNITKSTSPKIVPGFETASPPEVGLDHYQVLEGEIEKVFLNNDDAKALKQTAETRHYFVLDLERDPLIKNSMASLHDPERVLRSDLYSKKLSTDYLIRTCRESKPAIEFKCSKSLIPPTVHVEPAKYSRYWCKKGHHRPDNPKCKSKKYFRVPKMYEPEKVQTTPEAWVSDCGTMEAETKKRACRLVIETCPKGSETREVTATSGPKKTPVARQITRPCWRYEYVYECAYPSVNTCESLRKSTCEQIQSKCVKEFAGVCIEWEQTYRCPTQVREEKERVSTGGFSLPPEEPSPALTPNHDMQEAIAKLSVLNDIQDELRANGESYDADSIRIFKGKSRNCTIAFAGFKNCCGNNKGWGVSLKLSGCNGEEKDLAERQKKRLCVSIGTYCATKVAGICLRKKKAHCCFPSKLSRILHEQGRPQLKLGWGKPDHPHCQGFTVDQLSRLDFDKLDLSEVFAEIIAKTKQVTQTTVNVVTRNLSDRVSQMTSGFKTPDSANKPKSGDF
ncbi:MAG: conjugal transfer protein TraN [Alphaproteobacteria bacterium]|nr:conjugal transfer protein TraN [Alphaproteobacteria bacterium]MBP9777284.1 conjugal transfer protein TraN [Alphaproteobacteria bacterium]